MEILRCAAELLIVALMLRDPQTAEQRELYNWGIAEAKPWAKIYRTEIYAMVEKRTAQLAKRSYETQVGMVMERVETCRQDGTLDEMKVETE